MTRNPRLLGLTRVLLTVAVASIGVHAGAPDICLMISSETAPPGSIAQIKVSLTEPKPIITGKARMSLSGFSDITGIALGEAEAAATAVVRGTNVAISLVSPSGTLGLDEDDSDYPILLTIAGRVAHAPIGTKNTITLDPGALQFFDPSGAAYLLDKIESGTLTTDHALSMSNVTPGSADLPAGSVVTISGTNFLPHTRIRFNDVPLAQVSYVNPTRMDIVLAEPARMHGRRIRASNSEGVPATYISYQRASRAGTGTNNVLQNVVPVFPLTAVPKASIAVEGDFGLALQNLEPTDTHVFAELLTAQGLGVASSVIAVPSNRYIVRHLSEIFKGSIPNGSIVRLVAVTPVQVLGIRVDANGGATPRLPQ